MEDKHKYLKPKELKHCQLIRLHTKKLQSLQVVSTLRNKNLIKGVAHGEGMTSGMVLVILFGIKFIQ